MAKQTLSFAFFLTIIILLAELVGGLIGNSLALLSDAGHVVTDIFALALAWFATVQAERSEEHTSELQSQSNLVCRLLLEKKKRQLIQTDPRYIISTEL